jgi:hypothetical protein
MDLFARIILIASLNEIIDPPTHNMEISISEIIIFWLKITSFFFIYKRTGLTDFFWSEMI